MCVYVCVCVCVCVYTCQGLVADRVNSCWFVFQQLVKIVMFSLLNHTALGQEVVGSRVQFVKSHCLRAGSIGSSVLQACPLYARTTSPSPLHLNHRLESESCCCCCIVGRERRCRGEAICQALLNLYRLESGHLL